MSTTAAEEQRNDPIVEDDLRRGWALAEVPANLQAESKEAGLMPFTHIRLTRLNPTRRRKITEVVQRAYFRDLKDSELLSTAQVKALVEERGEWTTKHELRLAHLNERTTSKMLSVYHEGVRKSAEWLEEIAGMRTKFITIADESDKPEEEKAELKERFDRWYTYSPRQQVDYQQRYPTAVVDGLYYPDRDYSWLLDHSPTLEAADMLEDVDNLNSRIQGYITLVEERTEYDELRVARLRIFANTVESRRDNAEEMARVFHCTERCDADSTGKGPIAATFEQMYDLPDTMISWLVEEQFFFHNAIPPETREFLKGFGFLAAGTAKEEPKVPEVVLAPHEGPLTVTTGLESAPVPSDVLPVVPIPSIDSTPVVKTL